MDQRKPLPHELWKQANGDRAEYIRLMEEHGHLIRVSGKRVSASICPICGGTVLAPQSLDLHIEHEHPRAAPVAAGEGLREALEQIVAWDNHTHSTNVGSDVCPTCFARAALASPPAPPDAAPQVERAGLDARQHAVIDEAIQAVVARRERAAPAIGELDRLAQAVDDLLEDGPPAPQSAAWPSADDEAAVEALATQMALAGYADSDPVEQWRAPKEAARAILAALTTPPQEGDRGTS